MSKSVQSVATDEKISIRHARFQGAAGGVTATLAAVAIAAGLAYPVINGAREDVNRAHTERVSDLDSRLQAREGEVSRLREENKELLVKVQASKGELAAALDPGRRCAPLYAAVQQKQQIVIDKEARLPYEAPTAVKKSTSSVLIFQDEEDDNYSRFLRSIRDSKNDLASSEADWRACVANSRPAL